MNEEMLDAVPGAVTRLDVPRNDLDPGLPPTMGAQSIPDQDGLLGGGKRAALGEVMFEDFFPALDLSEEDKLSLSEWFEKDLRSAVRNVNKMRSTWAVWRAVYMLEYVEKFYPDMGIGANYASGLLCEKMLEGMDRMKKAILLSKPYFSPEPRTTGSAFDVEMLFRAQWYMHTILDEELLISDVLRDGPFFEFLLDGSTIIEADTIYEKIPQRTLKTYTSMEELAVDQDKALTDSHYQLALEDIQTHGVARMLVEQDIVTKNGLQLFHVDKVDHLIPEGVYSDRDIRFRGRRLYYTAADLRVLASEGAGWYDKTAVDELLEHRDMKRDLRQQSKEDEKAREMLNVMEEGYDLSYDWHSEEDQLSAVTGASPYEDVFAVYRVLCKFGYKTKQDPQGLVPKYCLFDYSPEGKKFLRAVAYPHFHESPNWFHFKLGYAPKSYWGFGYGSRLVQDDFLESNAVDLYLDGAALATFNPMLFRHPDSGGRYPWHAGFGPGKVGYLNNMDDFKPLNIQPPTDALLRHLLPLTANRSANRTSITSLVQGRTESSDPRAPAAKTAMLIQEANVGLDVMIFDWNKTGWERLADYVWKAKYESAIYIKDKGGDLREMMGGLVIDGNVSPDAENVVSLKELGLTLNWVSEASSSNLNPQMRTTRFLQGFQFFVPLLREMAQFNPVLYKKYFLRWMRRVGQEVDLPGMRFLIPTLDEIQSMPNDRLQSTMENIVGRIQSGQGPQSEESGGGRPAPERMSR